MFTTDISHGPAPAEASLSLGPLPNHADAEREAAYVELADAADAAYASIFREMVRREAESFDRLAFRVIGRC